MADDAPVSPSPSPLRPSSERNVWFVFGGAFAGVIYGHWLMNRPFVPGQWPGDLGMMFGFVESMVVGTGLLAALLYLGGKRRLLMVLALLAFTLPCFFSTTLASPDWRFSVEGPKYEQAIREGRRFGDQYEEEHRGRRLTYWRWLAWGIDNGLGVIYDPEDRLDLEEDRKVFRRATGGHLWEIRRLKPCWYYVSHT